MITNKAVKRTIQKNLKSVTKGVAEEVGVYLESKGKDLSNISILGFHGTNSDLSDVDYIKNLFFTSNPFYASAYGENMFVIVHKPSAEFSVSGDIIRDKGAEIQKSSLMSCFIKEASIGGHKSLFDIIKIDCPETVSKIISIDKQETLADNPRDTQRDNFKVKSGFLFASAMVGGMITKSLLDKTHKKEDPENPPHS